MKASHSIIVICAYCKKYLDTKDGQGVSGTSHSICRSCMSVVRTNMKLPLKPAVIRKQARPLGDF